MPPARTPGTADLTELLSLDRSSPVPLYYQIAQQVEQAVEEGRLTPGTRIDNELALAHTLGLSRPTVRRAMEYLVDKGLLVRRRGIGTRVVSPKVRRPLELSSLYDDLLRNGQRPRTRVLSNEIVPATGSVAESLELPEQTPVTEVVRLRYAMDQPIARLVNYLPAELLEVTTAALERTGLYELLRARGILLHSANQVIGARTATAAEARLLDERRNAALLTMQRTTHDDHGTAVEYGTHIYAASRYSFELSLLSM